MGNRRTVVWFSCGAASAVAAWLTPHGMLAYCETGAEHSDNERFLIDCEDWLGRGVERLRSDKYRDTWHVWEATRWLAGINGARCTGELKLAPRLAFQRPTDIHVFGYTSDPRDVKRATDLRANYPELTIEMPLIERGLTKAACLAMIERAGIEVPVMYRLGFHNNNCIPCVKATSPDYWSLIRQEFPVQFERIARLSRDLGVRLCRMHDERRFIDEIPENWPTTNPIAPACDFLCAIAEMEAAE